ncbi:MAG: response regulator transcription factor [Lachnospiraceae bacterium]|nr:response regulator transcription factor [Lachnospiraceae bacterium]
MLKIAVCDDEPSFLKQIGGMIKKQMPDCIITEFLSGEDLLLCGELFDIYILDVQMEKMNGIETAKKLRETDERSIIIFITGAKEYVFDAFDVAALHYLVKPVDDKKLYEALCRAEKQMEKNRNREDRRIFIKTRKKNITLNISDIYYFENEMRKIAAHTARGVISFYGVMADMEKEAGAGFCRCHRGYLVNLSYIAEYDSETITLSDGEKILISKDRYHDFVKQYMRFLRNGGVSHV